MTLGVLELPEKNRWATVQNSRMGPQTTTSAEALVLDVVTAEATNKHPSHTLDAYQQAKGPKPW